MFRLIWAAGDSCGACGKRQPLGIENTGDILVARCLACGARFEVELTSHSEGTRQALVQFMHSIVAANDRMADLNRNTEVVMRPLSRETKA